MLAFTFLGLNITFWNFVLAIASMIIASAIVERSKWPNWAIIPVAIVTFFAIPILWAITKIVVIALLIIGAVIVGLMWLNTLSNKSKT